MPIWKYRAKSETGNIIEKYIEMAELEGNEIECIAKIDRLRAKLRSEGYQFIDARPLSESEIALARKELRLKNFKKPRRLKKAKNHWRPVLVVGFLLLLLALVGLVIWLRLYM